MPRLLALFREPNRLTAVRKALPEWEVTQSAEGDIDCVLSDFRPSGRFPCAVVLVGADPLQGGEVLPVAALGRNLGFYLHQAMLRHRLVACLQSRNQELEQLNLEQQERLGHYYDEAPVGYLRIDLSTTILELNKTAAALLNLTRAQAQGTRLFDLLAEQSRPELLRTLARRSELSCLALHLQDASGPPLQLTAWLKEGVFQAILADIGWQVRAQAAEGLLEVLPQAVIQLDSRARVRAFNRAALANFGARPEQMRESHLAELFPDCEGLLEPGERLVPALRTDATWFPARVSTHHLNGDAVLVITDLTATRQMQREVAVTLEQERRRIGRDLHDDLGQLLTGLAYLAEHLHSKLPAEQRELGTRVAQMAREGVAKTRLLSRGLYPFVLEVGGLVEALRELASSTAQVFRVRCDVSSDVLSPIPDGASLHLYRIAQQAVANAVSHGAPSAIKIGLECSDGELALTIRDNGKGLASTHAPGLGMRNMAHHAALLGAEIGFSSPAEGGTLIRLHLDQRNYEGVGRADLENNEGASDVAEEGHLQDQPH